jgi:hypothetical protein
MRGGSSSSTIRCGCTSGHAAFATRVVRVSSELRRTVAAREGGRLRIDTPQGPILAEGDLPAGVAAVVSTRPEKSRSAHPKNRTATGSRGAFAT